MARPAPPSGADRCAFQAIAGGDQGAYATDDKTSLGQIQRPWGYELRFAHTEHYAGKIVHVRAGNRLPVELHRSKDGTSYLLSGQVTVWAGPTGYNLDQAEVTPGYSWRVRPGEAHSIEALEDSVIFEVSTPQLEDEPRSADGSVRVAPPPKHS